MKDGGREMPNADQAPSASTDFSVPSADIGTGQAEPKTYVLGRPERSPDTLINATKASGPDVDRWLDGRLARGEKLRGESWAKFRHKLTMTWFICGSVLIFFALVLCIYVMLTESHSRLELAHRLLETLVGGLGAGLIGLFAVKSFEK